MFLHITYILDSLVTVHILRFVKLSPRSSSVKRNDGSYTAICNKNHHLHISILSISKSYAYSDPVKFLHSKSYQSKSRKEVLKV